MSQELEKRLMQLIQTFRPQSKIINLKKLAGEASYREYFRLTLDNNSKYIVMKMPAGQASVSEEVTKLDQDFEDISFINLQKYLSSLSLPVPHIYAFSENQDLLILEDFGDQSLERCVLDQNNSIKESYYKKAIDLLSQLQEKTSHNTDKSCMAFHKKFDEDLLIWEMQHFLEYGIEDRLQIKVSDKHRQDFHDLSQSLVKRIVEMPQSFVHRDFQSRNLIVFEDQLKLIDFQDALIGPYIYDLVALLRDSYINISDELCETLLNYYQEKSAYGSALKSDFNTVTVQRKLKDAGRFQYIKTHKNNSSFLKHLPQTLTYVKKALSGIPEGDELQKVIAHYLEDF